MNLLDQIKPVDSTDDKIDVQVEEIQIEQEIVQEQEVTVTSLDSGEVEVISTVSEIPEISEIADLPELSPNTTIYDVRSFCYKYLMYSKEFTKLYKLDPLMAKKFTNEVEWIHAKNDDRLNQDLINYLNKNYNRINFEMNIMVEDFPNRRPLTIKDSIHFRGDIAVVPSSYDAVIDSILNKLDHNFNYVQFLDVLGSSRDIKPTNEFKIDYTNQKYCPYCKFFSVCDETKIKI